MALFTQTRDLWKTANNQIGKLKVEKPQQQVNPYGKMSNRSMDQIFGKSGKILNELMPTNQQYKASTLLNIPPSVKILDQYAQKLGFLPMGQIYDGSGKKYIGRSSQLTSDGKTFYKQFFNFGQQTIDTPDITQNLTFQANRAINKWNQFVKAQSQLAKYLQKIQTEEGRKNIIFTFAHTATLASDQLRMLSTLYYYYVDEKSSRQNVLLLTRDIITQLIAQLKKEAPIPQAFRNSINLIRGGGRTDIIEHIINYHNYKINTIRQSLTPSEFAQFNTKMEAQADMAYVPDEMITTPMKITSDWAKVFHNKTGNWQSKFVIKNWSPNAPWFRAVNYLKR